jgi:predicted dehydrogenase
MKRRSFLPAAAAATFGFQVVPSHVVRAQEGKPSPNSKIRLAVIGCGGQGEGDLNNMATEDIVALCDVDDRRAAGSFNKFPQAKRFKDFRKMFDNMAGQIDAVLVATPDHTHYVASMAAMQHGKHVYCEKPLAHTVAEVRAMQKVAKEKKLITQVGNQGHSSHSIRAFVEMVQSGSIGNVSEVHAGCDAFKDIYCMIHRRAELEQKPAVPSELDWDLWQGPLKPQAYSPLYVPFNWRGFSAFGSGCIGDWVCHVLDPSFWALDLDLPTAITAEVKGYDPEKDAAFYPKGTRITFEFAAKGARGPVKIIWHDGDFTIPQHEDLKKQNRQPVGIGAIVIGDKGRIMHGSHGAGSPHIITHELLKDFKRPEEKIARVKNGNHHQEWLSAVREGRQAGSSFEYGGALSEIGLLGMIAVRRPGVRLEWDASAMKFKNDEAANALLRPQWRDGWGTI